MDVLIAATFADTQAFLYLTANMSGSTFDVRDTSTLAFPTTEGLGSGTTIVGGSPDPQYMTYTEPGHIITTSVPEPASGTAITLVALALMTRRTKRRCN